MTAPVFPDVIRAHYPELAERFDLLARARTAHLGVVDLVAVTPIDAAHQLEALSAIVLDCAQRIASAGRLSGDDDCGAAAEHALRVAVTNAMLLGVWAAQRGLAKVPDRA